MHSSGVLSTLVMSFDAVATSIHPIEIHGSAGSLAVPDPNRFDGDVSAAPPGRRGLGDPAGERGLRGAPPAASACRTWPLRGADLRASGRLGLHALEVMNAVLASSRSGSRVEVESTCERPEAVPLTDVRG
jgi:predicted dehydrogenase